MTYTLNVEILTCPNKKIDNFCTWCRNVDMDVQLKKLKNWKVEKWKKFMTFALNVEMLTWIF